MRLLLTLITLCFSSGVFAANCGGLNQRPCNIFERVPSCNKGLVENFAQKKCLQAAPQPAQRASPAAKQRPGHCGRHQQRPCNVAEFIPSCESSLVEHQGQCKTRTESMARANCGKQDQRACNVLERIPSCDAGLAEIRGICKRKGDCGAAGQRPCEIGERIPSCNAGLKESFKKHACVGLAPGETPFTGGLASLSEFYGDGVKALCQQGLGTIRIDTSTPVGLGAECTKNVFIGAACDFIASKLLGGDAVGMVGQIADSPRAVAAAAAQAKRFEGKVNVAYQSAACLQFAEKLTPATSHGRSNSMKCSGGQFWDPNGSCYSCPAGYTRTLEPVTSARACVDKPAGELLRSSCAVFKAASEDMAKGVKCTSEILTSGVFIDQKIGFAGASKGFCIATGELTYAIVDVMLPGKTPDKKAQQITTSLNKFVQKIKQTGKTIGSVAGIASAGSAVSTEFDKLKSCR